MKKRYQFLVVLISLNLVSAQDTTEDRTVNQKEGVGIEGYDAVSYFIGKPLKGKDNYQTRYKGVTYKFTNESNLNTFQKDPENYLPVYGGWCAYAVGDSGDLVPVDPGSYKIIDGKLYLFYHSFFNNTLKKWNKEEAQLLQKADMNWEERLKKRENE